MKNDKLKEAVASVLGITVKDVERLAEHPAARVTVSAPGGFHVQSVLSEVMDRCADEFAKVRPVKAKVVTDKPAAPPVDPTNGSA